MGIALKHLSEAKRAEIARSLYKVTFGDKNRGKIIGLCPIHNENNPSFSYNYKKDVYKCLSCNADGDLLKLWSEVRGLGQKEGFRAFCTEYGIELEHKKNNDCHSREGRYPVSFYVLNAPLHPPSPVNKFPSHTSIYRVFRPGMSGRVRVHPGNFSFYFFLTYTLGPGGPGENRHTRMRARV